MVHQEFVIDSFEKLLEDCGTDFGPLYDAVREKPEVAPRDVLAEDEVVTRGDFRYFIDKGKMSPRN